MKIIEGKFRHNKVDFEVIKRGEKAIMLKVNDPDYESLEVWQIRISPERVLGGKLIEAGEKKPNNDDYPFVAHQFVDYCHPGGCEEMERKALKRFNEYETGVRPKKLRNNDGV